MPTKKLFVPTYLQYVSIGAGALLLFAFVRQLGGVLLTSLSAEVSAYVVHPLVRWLEERGLPRVVAVLGVFATLVAAVLVALFVLIVTAAGKVRALVQDPQVLLDGAAALVDRIRGLPYAGDRIAALDQEALYEFARANAPSAGRVFNGASGFIGAVSIGAMIASVLRYPRGAPVFELWRQAPVVRMDAAEAWQEPTLEDAAPGKAPPDAVLAGNLSGMVGDGGKRSSEAGR